MLNLDSHYCAPLSIAIVDDDEKLRVSLVRLCRALGMRTAVYASGVELIDAVRSGACPDCLILDAHMPNMTGLEVQQRLAAQGARFPTIVYSADDAPEALDRFVAAGAAAYLRKPITADLLVSAIERAVAPVR